jgi:hypothetical protein
VRTDTRFKIGQTVSGWQLYELIATDPATGGSTFRAKKISCGHYDKVTSHELISGQRVCSICDPKRIAESPKEWLAADRQKQADAAEQARRAELERQRQAEADRIAAIRKRRDEYFKSEGTFAPKPVDSSEAQWDPYLSRWFYPSLGEK